MESRENPNQSSANASEPIWRRLEASTGARGTVTVTVDGQPQCVPAGITLATALLCCGARTFQRNPAGNDPRAPYCMMGACFECLVDVDGEVHTQSCMVVVREGMNVRTGRSVTEPGGDPA